MPDNPHKNHRMRMRKRYRTNGLEGFADHEVLELLLYHCYARCDTNPIAHEMLDKFRSLHNLFETDVDSLMKTLNCTENVAVFLNLIPAVANRYYRSKWSDGVILDDYKIAGEYVMDLFVGDVIEKFYVLCLDKKNRLINNVLVSKGTLDESAVYLREIFDAALKNNAVAIILAHNHPGGTSSPSQSDVEATRQIIKSVNTIHIDVIDHVISAGDTYYSFASRNHLVRGYGY